MKSPRSTRTMSPLRRIGEHERPSGTRVRRVSEDVERASDIVKRSVCESFATRCGAPSMRRRS